MNFISSQKVRFCLGPGSMAEACAFSGNAAGTISAVPIGFHVSGRYVVDNGSIKDGNNNVLGGPATGNGSFTLGEISTITKPTNVDVSIGGALEAQFFVAPNESTRGSLAGINNGALKITNAALNPIIAAERVIYKAAGGVNTSFMEMMGLPGSQLDTIFWLPWYNNVDLNTQLRFANTTTSTATVRISIGGTKMQGSPFTLLAGESTRQSFTNINSGPVEIVSTVPIVAAERLIYKVNNLPASFTEMMALPDNQLDTTLWFPWYNNVDLDTQLRFGIP